MSLLRLLCLSFLVAAPGLAQERGRLLKARPEADAGGSLTLTLRVQTREGAMLRNLVSEETLRSGDFLQFFLAVDRTAYVYVVQYFSDGSAAVLYPEKGDAVLRPGFEMRIPEDDFWYQLDDNPGEDVVYFIASAEELGSADLRVGRALEMIRERSEAASEVDGEASADVEPSGPTAAAGPSVTEPPTGEPPAAELPTRPPPPPSAPSRPPAPLFPEPEEIGLTNRGRLIKVRAEGAAAGPVAVAVEADADGVVIYRFVIRHVD